MNLQPIAPPSSWIELSAEVAGIDSEVVADIFRQACPGGVAVELSWRLDPNTDAYAPGGDGPAVVKGYIQAGCDSARVRRNLRIAVQAAPLLRPATWRRSRRIRESSWRDVWKKNFRVQRLGRSLVVAPSWARYALRRGDIVLRIDPGMAFGTGQHPTTAMCLRAIEEFVRPGMRVLDLGSGSGILSIAAAKVGATRVLALDLDPLAVKATRENAAANSVAHVIESREGTLDVQPSGEDGTGEATGFDVIAANISGLALHRLAPAIATALRPGGVLICSGFLEDTVDSLRRSCEGAGLRVQRVDAEGVWRAMVVDG